MLFSYISHSFPVYSTFPHGFPMYLWKDPDIFKIT